MKRFRNNQYLLDKKRVEKLQQQQKRWLRNLPSNKAIRLEESLISSALIWEWRKNFFEDKPVCLKIGLSKKRKT